MIPPLFVDEHVGHGLRDYLKSNGFDVKTHADAGLPLGTNDVEWISVVSGHGWAALTADVKQTCRVLEREAIQKGPLKHIVIRSRNLTGAVGIQIVEKHMTALKVVLAYLPPPFSLRLLKDNVQLKSFHEDLEAVAKYAAQTVRP